MLNYLIVAIGFASFLLFVIAYAVLGISNSSMPKNEKTHLQYKVYRVLYAGSAATFAVWVLLCELAMWEVL
ncbi:hypothetical protein tloyanaT_26080 [Thalassotalea loyana]|uniref:Uncharacterized protein n=1 Tax=Thalassotalea loyana TaxID=280483 RepID=A0ABQ6HE06_9GAMM|nr:hypothetical protein [Thalassotalea loyana]GLX86355.1 hypothetical protein tloyanaT_26080 [Thalassotalea loyana]